MLRRPEDLRCDSLRSPEGIDNPRPVLSWSVDSSDRNVALSRCEIEIYRYLADSRESAVWKSGEVDTDFPSVICPEEILEEHSLYGWRVRWRDEKGVWSDFSDFSTFSTGFLATQWQARWITTSEPEFFRTKGTYILGEYIEGHLHTMGIYLRKEFNTSDQISRATAYVSGVGYYELHINGEKVGDRVLDPAQTAYEKYAMYSTFDVTHYLGKENAVGMILGNGRHIDSYGYGIPEAIFQLRLEYADGRVENLCSDTTWKCSGGPIRENGIYYGETYDATKEIFGWDRPGFDDSGWGTSVPGRGSELRSQSLEPIKVIEELAPIALERQEPGVFIFDFGQNFTGWVRLKVRGPRGSCVRLRFSELLNKDGSINTLPMENAEATDTYVLKGEGTELYEPTFTYHGFRYAEVTGYPGVPTLESITGIVVHSSVEKTGDFFCENELINRVHECVLWGQKSNLMSIPTDCPQRDERHGWLGDAHLAAEESMYNFSMKAFYEKFLDDIAASQRDDGALPDVVPGYYKLYPADPAWGTAYITIAWDLFNFYGDRSFLCRHYTGMKKYVDFLSTLSNNGIIEFGKYGDWCPPGSILPKRTPVALTSTWYYYHDTFLLSKIAGVIGLEGDSLLYLERANQVKQAFNREFLKKDHYAVTKMSPRESLDNALLGQTSNALPLALDMVPEEIGKGLFERLVDYIVRRTDCHVDTGIVGTKYILDVLSEGGRADIAYRMVSQESYPGWGYMINQGATTLWERWEYLTGSSMNSHNHIMLGSVDAWFYKNIGGLAPLEPGWKKIRFSVPLYKNLGFASAGVRTPFGTASISWERFYGYLILCLSVPVSTTALVEIPVKPKGAVLESERSLADRGIKVLEEKEGKILIEIGSGLYSFRSEI